MTFPTLFDLIDESETFEVDGVDKSDYSKVVDQCFLCDLCAETKCPYVPPHEWAIDFPHLMLRAKRKNSRPKTPNGVTGSSPLPIQSSTYIHSRVAQVANIAADSKPMRKMGEKLLGLHRDAPLPKFLPKALTKSLPDEIGSEFSATATDRTTGKVAIYVTCYGDHNEPQMVEDLISVLEHNRVPVKILKDARCCGMPKLELGDLRESERMKDANVPLFLEAIEEGPTLLHPSRPASLCINRNCHYVSGGPCGESSICVL